MPVRHWWEAPEWGKERAMDFGKEPKLGHFRRVPVTTDPDMVRQKNGALRLVLKNRHPHVAVRVYVGASQRARC